MITTEWKIVTYVQIAFFAIIAALFTFINIKVLAARRNAIDPFEKNITSIYKFFLLYMTLFITFKITGGICACVWFRQKRPSEGLTIATFIFDSVSLSMLIKSFLPMIEFLFDKRSDMLSSNHMTAADDWKQPCSIEQTPKPRFHPFLILTLLILVALILSIVGYSDVTSDPQTYKTLTKVSSILFLAAVAVSSGLLIFLITSFQSSTAPYATVAMQQGAILLSAAPFLLIRCLYSILSAFSDSNIFDGQPSKYSLLFGQFEWYTFMALMEECITSLIIIFNIYYFIKNVEYMR